tara:strand:+ start:1706 stop:2122 length:417 start_codon:yes stop_codon:yes gene_type:complete
MSYLLFIFLFVGFLRFSRTISKQVTGVAGTTYENENNKLSYTSRELVVSAMTSEDESIQLENGYYPSLGLSTQSIESQGINLHVRLYPNTVKETFSISHPTEQNFKVKIRMLTESKYYKRHFKKHNPYTKKASLKALI